MAPSSAEREERCGQEAGLQLMGDSQVSSSWRAFGPQHGWAQRTNRRPLQDPPAAVSRPSVCSDCRWKEARAALSALFRTHRSLRRAAFRAQAGSHMLEPGPVPCSGGGIRPVTQSQVGFETMVIFWELLASREKA